MKLQVFPSRPPSDLGDARAINRASDASSASDGCQASPIQKDDSEKAVDTYFGKRAPAGRVCLSMNAYEFIRSFELANISALPAVPDVYVKCLFIYIIQISRALSHCHQHGLTHGNLNLSKVLA